MNTTSLYVINNFDAKPQYMICDNERRIDENYKDTWVYVDPTYYTSTIAMLEKNLIYILRYNSGRSLNGQINTNNY
jgi:hypothetical protein